MKSLRAPASRATQRSNTGLFPWSHSHHFAAYWVSSQSEEPPIWSPTARPAHSVHPLQLSGAPLSSITMSPDRVLGEAHSDNPYDEAAPKQNGGTAPGEISSLEDQPGPTERTALLSSSSPPVRKKAVVRTSSGRSDPASFSANEEDPVVVAKPIRRRPWSLKLDFGIGMVLLYANFSFLLLSIAAINSPFIAHNALPAHRGSMFVPIWVTLLSTTTNV